MKTHFYRMMIVLMGLVGCMNPGPTPLPALFVTIYYQNQQGQDLFNPLTPSAYNKNGVVVYDWLTSNGVSSKKNSNMNCSNYVCLESSGNYAVEFTFLPMPSYSGTIIALNTGVSDTLYYQFALVPQQGYEVKQILYKKNIIWNTGMSTPPVITIKH